MECAGVARLTPTSFAILGYLASRPWSAYELTKQMRDALRLAWTRTEASIYGEPKNLVQRGLATAAEEENEGRRRTVYTITEEGRAELRAWFDRDSAPPVHEFEALLKVGFAENADRAATIADLERTEAQARAVITDAWAAYPRYLERAGTNPERLHNLFIYGKFINDYTALIVSWAQWAREQIAARPEQWPKGAEARILAFTTPD